MNFTLKLRPPVRQQTNFTVGVGGPAKGPRDEIFRLEKVYSEQVCLLVIINGEVDTAQVFIFHAGNRLLALQ